MFGICLDSFGTSERGEPRRQFVATHAPDRTTKESPMSEMLFLALPTYPMPTINVDQDGNPITPDGVNVLSFEQAVKKYQIPPERLRLDWTRAFGPKDPEIHTPPNPSPQPVLATDTSQTKTLRYVPDNKPDIAWASLGEAARHEAVCRHHIYGHLSDEHYNAFLLLCKRYNVDPIDRLIYPVLKYDPETARTEVLAGTTINYLRLRAERTGEYMGQEHILYSDNDGNWKDVWTHPTEMPLSARIAVKHATRGLVTAPVYFREVARYKTLPNGTQVLSDRWKQQPLRLIAKCALAASIREAWPDACNGLYTMEELDRFEEAPRRRREPITESSGIDRLNIGLSRPGTPSDIDRPFTPAATRRRLVVEGAHTALLSAGPDFCTRHARDQVISAFDAQGGVDLLDTNPEAYIEQLLRFARHALLKT